MIEPRIDEQLSGEYFVAAWFHEDELDEALDDGWEPDARGTMFIVGGTHTYLLIMDADLYEDLYWG